MAKTSTKKPQSTSRAQRSRSARPRRLPGAHRRSAEPFAVTIEGNVYVNIDALAAVGAANLKDRKLFIGAELGRGERRLARTLLDNAGHKLGAKIAGPLARRRAPKPTSKPE